MQVYVAIHFTRRGAFDWLEYLTDEQTPEEYLEDAKEAYPESANIKFVVLNMPDPVEEPTPEVEIVATVDVK